MAALEETILSRCGGVSAAELEKYLSAVTVITEPVLVHGKDSTTS